MKRILLSLIASLAFSSLAYAAGDSTIIIADDSSTGTYRKMLTEVTSICASDKFNILEAKNGGGAVGNLEALANNQAQAAFLHSDVYFANLQADSTYARFQTLVSLYPEPIHVLVLANSKSKGSGMNYFSSVTFRTLSDLKGYRVGAAGGGVYTARILTGQGEGGFTVVPYTNGGTELKALRDGDIDAAIYVGAAPLPNIAGIPDKSTFRIIPIGDAIGSRVSGIYRPVTVNYPGITSGPVKTLAPMATLLTRKFSTPAKVAAQKALRECFVKNIDELKDNGSPNWQNVNINDHGSITWYEMK